VTRVASGAGRAGLRVPARGGRRGPDPAVSRGHAHRPRTPPDAVGCELGQIVKSLVFVCDGKPVVALVPGDRRGDSEQDRRPPSRRARREWRRRRRSRQATGFAPGAVPPFPLPEDVVVLMDGAFFRHPLIWAGAGSAAARARHGSFGARESSPGTPARRFLRLTYGLPNPKEPSHASDREDLDERRARRLGLTRRCTSRRTG
jgi:prolyl-tRNA editing enzyme YbaK/EbsC (Cys-tRNA(Pro) deacylase)